MTESADADVSKPLAGEVTLYQKPTYTVVKFLLQNPRENPVLVTMRQTLPDSVEETQVTFAEEYNGAAWEYENGELRFQMQLAGEELVETAYGTRDISLETLQQQIRVSTITITDETGEQLGTVTGLQPTVAEVSDESGEGETENVEDESRAEEEAKQEDEDDPSDEEEANDRIEAEEEGEQIDEEEVEHGGETQSEDESGMPPDDAHIPGEDEESTDKPEPDETDSEDRASESETDEALRAESREDTEAIDENGKDESTPEAEADSNSEQEITADLPANRSDYILEDVKDQIESAEEFDWQPVQESAEQSGGIIGWVKSIFGR